MRLLVPLAVVFAATSAGSAQTVTVTPRKTDTPAAKLFQEGRFDEGRLALQLGDPAAYLVMKAEEWAAAGKTADALTLFEAYLHHYPFGSHVEWTDGMQPWRFSNQDEWHKAATGYLALLSKGEKLTAAWFTQSEAAAPVYARLRGAYAKKDWRSDEELKLADEIITKYPKSLFVQPAVLTVVDGRAGRTLDGGSADRAAVFRDYLKKMDAAGVPKEERVLVLLALNERTWWRQVTDGKPTDFAILDEVEKLAASPLVRRGVAREAFSHHMKANDLEAARKVGWKFVATFAADARGPARLELVTRCLEAKDPDEARQWVQNWRLAKAYFDEPTALRLIAAEYGGRRQWGQAIACYDEAIRANPDGLRTPSLKLELALLHKQAGNEDKMVALLKHLAATVPPGPDGGPAGAGLWDVRAVNDARAHLAEYHMGKKEWKEALPLWEAWDPTAGIGCFTGLDLKEVNKVKDARVAECRKHLAPPPG